MLATQIPGYIRTFVPVAVGYLLTWLAQTAHIVVTPNSEGALVAFTTALLTAVYYTLVRLLEAKWPKAGILLGYPSKPNYAPIGADGVALVTSLVDNFTGPDPLADHDVEVHEPETAEQHNRLAGLQAVPLGADLPSVPEPPVVDPPPAAP